MYVQSIRHPIVSITTQHVSNGFAHVTHNRYGIPLLFVCPNKSITRNEVHLELNFNCFWTDGLLGVQLNEKFDTYII